MARPVAALTALALGTLTAAATATSASATPTNGPDTRERSFATAAAEFGVPVGVLEAVSYAQTRWEAHAGEHNTGGGYGPMNLVDGTLFTEDVGAQRDGTSSRSVIPASVDTLGRAAAILGVDRDALRRDPATNIRGGAALLKATQASLALPLGTGTDVGQWYASVAAASGSTDATDAADFADAAFQTLTSGAARTTTDGQSVSVGAQPTTPQRGQLARLGLKAPKPDPNLECPRSIPCESVPAPYQEFGDGDYGNHDLAARDTAAGPRIDHIVIHDTEADWATTLKLVQDPTYVSWHYSIRSSDGQVAQHVPTKDVAWHAGNWYLNMHSIGIEHEGFAASGATWYSEPLYRNSALLVRYLAKRYDIPLDRAHIIGHDQVPGTIPSTVAGMHWDPGPYWDWEHYFELMGAPLQRGWTGSSDVVRILPGFDRNRQVVTGCDASGSGQACAPQGTNFVYLHTAPSDQSPLVADVGQRSDGRPSTTDVADIGARATAGVEYAVADRSGDWTAIWWLGQKAWFLNPAKKPTAIPVKGSIVVPKAGRASVPVYGRAYPEAAAYAAYPGVPVQTVVPLQYALPAGQAAALQDANVVTDYYRASTFAGQPPTDHVDVRGQDRYYQVSLGHRSMFVRAADVDVVPAG